MAYIKGGSVVDGNLYVEGGLRVNDIKDAAGNTYPYVDTYLENRLLKWGDVKGAMVTSPIANLEEEEDETKTIRSIINVYGYKTFIPLVLATKTTDIITGGGLSEVTYFDTNFNKTTETANQKYRTLTSNEKTYFIDYNIGLSPDAWAYSPAV